MNIFQSNEAENDESASSELPIETAKSRVIVKNLSMRNSIGAKDSILRIVKEKKLSNRYG